MSTKESDIFNDPIDPSDQKVQVNLLLLLWEMSF